MKNLHPILVLAGLIFSQPLGAIASELPERVQFNRDIRPILANNCFSCHGPDAKHRKGDLQLDQRELALKAGALIPGNTGDSPMIQRILAESDEERMPPPGSHKKLTTFQKELLKLWVSQGAEYEKHWSYEPPKKLVVEANMHPIDFFVTKRLSEIGLKASPIASRRILIRRLYADLLGLPPKPSEVTQFEMDHSEDAYGRLVDRVLENPHYGERMALAWLDVVRFADTAGYHSDNPRNVWPYRDWVIRSFNENKRFDRFTIEQIAGDLLPDANLETRLGSAFNRLIMSTEEGGAQPKDYEARMLTDRVRAIGAAWLGQTTGCAQCHDHKYDPFTSRDFYALGAFFADIKEPIVGRREDGIPVPSPGQTTQLADLTAARDAAQQAVNRAGKDATDDEKQALRDAEKSLKSFTDQLPKCIVSESAPVKRVVRILPRGNWMDESGQPLTPALPHYLPQPDYGERELTRLDLAQWLVWNRNPLTARTVMNRLWKQLFGSGLSRVLEDLGAQGEPPVNPELLDWLAAEFMDSGWDVKHMVRTIVTSHTYRQVANVSPEHMGADPNNRFTARQSSFRLDAELIRDHLLSFSGLLNESIGGPSMKPYQPARYWENLNFPEREYVADSDENQYRRGLYIWWQRSFLHPSLLAFDAPSREECAADRPRSNIPQQALVLLNDPSYVEAARVFAARILNCGKSNDDDRMVWAWQEALQRNPSERESTICKELLASHREKYSIDAGAVDSLLKVGLAPTSGAIDRKELAAWTHISRVLFNLHETITRN